MSTTFSHLTDHLSQIHEENIINNCKGFLEYKKVDFFIYVNLETIINLSCIICIINSRKEFVNANI